MVHALFLQVLIGFVGVAQAQCTYTTVANGNWNSAATWSCSGCGGGACGTPNGTANIVIAHNVNLNTDYTTTGTLTVNASRTLSTNSSGPGGRSNLTAGAVTVNGTLAPWNLTVTSVTANAGSTVNVQSGLASSGAVTASGSFSVAGNATVTGNLTFNSGATLGGSLSVGGNASLAGTINVASSGTFSGTLTNTGTTTVGGNTTVASTFNNSGVFTLNGNLTTSGPFSNTNDFFVNGSMTANGTFNNTDTMYVSAAFTNTVSGTNTGAMRVDGLFDNSETAAPGQTTFINNGNVWANGGLTNNGGLFTNNDFIKVVGNLRNNPGGILNGNGSWDVTINAINTAGGTITGGLDFCDYAYLSSCLAGCGTAACSTNCYINANPLVSPSGTIDSTNLRLCGVRVRLPLGVDPLYLAATRSSTGEVALRWYRNHEDNLATYTLHRSVGGGIYTPIYEQQQHFTTDQPLMHYYTDRAAPGGQLIYKVVRTDLDGVQIQSNIVILNGGGSPTLMIYPNPSRGNVQLSMAGLQPGTLTIEIYDLQGKALQRMVQTVNDGQEAQNMPITMAYAPGQYVLKATNGSTMVIERILVQ